LHRCRGTGMIKKNTGSDKGGLWKDPRFLHVGQDHACGRSIHPLVPEMPGLPTTTKLHPKAKAEEKSHPLGPTLKYLNIIIFKYYGI
jgi:hypothetical protein